MIPPACFPGTTIPTAEIPLLDGIFMATNGITLSQVCEITGLEPVAIQNWVKRGYVNPPVGRKYTKGQVARIILINILRETMNIERVARLLSYVNGNLLDRSDDIMDDSDIYKCLCDILLSSDQKKGWDLESLFAEIDRHLKNYTEPWPGSKERLKQALKAMVCACESAKLKKLAIQLTENM